MSYHIELVVKKDGKYLDAYDKWNDAEHAYYYASSVAFTHADRFDGEVLIRLRVSGREFKVTEEDFHNNTNSN